MKNGEAGVSLIELLIATVLSTVVLLTASNLILSFGNFSSDFAKNEASVMGTALGPFEEIVAKITVSNQVTLPATTVTPSPSPSSSPYNSIEIRVAPSGPATSDHANDTVHFYWQEGNLLKYKSTVGTSAASSPRTIAKDLVTVAFSPVSSAGNAISLSLVMQPNATDTNPLKRGPKETLNTLAVARSRSAQ